MSDRIEELKRQRDAARQNAKAAVEAHAAAEARLKEALAVDSGWMNQIVEVNGARYLVRDVKFISDSPWMLMLSAFKKDGKPSAAVRVRYLNGYFKPTKLGEYAA